MESGIDMFNYSYVITAKRGNKKIEIWGDSFRECELKLKTKYPDWAEVSRRP